MLISHLIKDTSSFFKLLSSYCGNASYPNRGVVFLLVTIFVTPFPKVSPGDPYLDAVSPTVRKVSSGEFLEETDSPSSFKFPVDVAMPV
jgi:hypothetical protein